MQETMLQNRKPVIRSYWLVGACIAVGFIASICIGNYPISIREIISILTGGEVGAMTRKVFFTLRLPRTCMGVMAGAGLGVAGSVYQMIFRNPLASPDIIGVSSGANLGAAIAIVSVGIGVGGIALGAFAGGLLAVAFVMLLVRATREKLQDSGWPGGGYSQSRGRRADQSNYRAPGVPGPHQGG